MKTRLDWSAYENAGMGDAYADIPRHGGDFAKAVAVCINSRQCEGHGRGVMCPSYRVSDNPLFATGGRVRLLKAALNGEPRADLFGDPRLDEAMELCVSCKGCKRECENEVDMARIKIEYLAQRNAAQGVGRRARLFAGLPRLLWRRPWLARLIRRRNRWPWLARLGESLLGISARRRLPEPASRPLPEAPPAAAEAPPVVLFIDTFTRHFHPEHAEAALKVLQAAGYRVLLAAEGSDGEGAPPQPLCCGRSLLSQGLVEEARAEARRVIGALLPHAEAGLPIVGLEPSCLLALRDEYLALGLGEGARQVADKALLFEEFVAREQAAKRFEPPWRRLEGAPPLLVHGHCHEKAVGAMKAMRKVLKQVPGLEFELVESSCCGMAGSFGLEAEHAELALAMAEQELLPALRARPEAQILANGFSCRHQIHEGTARRALHLAEVLAQRL